MLSLVGAGAAREHVTTPRVDEHWLRRVLERGRRSFLDRRSNGRENERQSVGDRKEGKLRLETIPP